MQIVSLISQKGGAGKTTLAINLAVAAGLAGYQAALIDLDPQASSAQWGDSREAPEPAIVSVPAARLTQVLEAAKGSGADFCVIDTAPHSESASLAAARASDLCLVPVRPAILDLRAIALTLDMLQLVKARRAIVLNSIPTKGLGAEATAALTALGCPLGPSVWQRVAFMHALTAGLGVQEYEPEGKAAGEIRSLFGWLTDQLSSPT